MIDHTTMPKQIILFAFALLLQIHLPAQCWESVSLGQIHSAGIRSDGSLWTWGWNNFGQLGNGNTIPHSSPEQVGSDTDWATVNAASLVDNNLAIGGSHTLAVKDDGTLWAWGRNSHGQLGDGTLVDKNAPTQVGSGTDWAAVQCGALHTLAIKTDGTMWSWGHNLYGQLGIGSTADVHVPTQVGSANNWLHIATAGEHSLAIATDSSLWSWGLNNYYQLGFFNDNQNKLVPTHVGGNTDWRSITTGRHYSFAIKNDNTLWGWGRNDYGQLGLGNVSSYHPIPEQIGVGAYWQEVDCGLAHTLAQRTDGSLYGWGYNYDGQLGVANNTFYHLSAQQIANGVGSASVSAGANSSASIRTDGTLWSWGRNSEGALGLGDQNARNVPVMVSCVGTVSVEVLYANTFEAHPIPTRGMVQLNKQVEQLRLFDLNCRLLQQQDNVSRIDLTPLQSGTYILQVLVNGKREQVRVVRE